MAFADTNEGDIPGYNSRIIIRFGIGFLGLLLLAIIISRITYPFDLGHLEAFNWMPAEHLLEGKNPYAFAFTPPYSMAPYGVVFYALLAVGIKFFGFQLWFGRLLSVLGLGVCLWVAIQITKKITGSRGAGLAAGLAGLAMFPGQIWVCMMRADLIGAAFGLTAVWLVFKVKEKEKTKLWLILTVGILAADAFFTKQTFFLPAGIIVLRFLQLGKLKAAIGLIAECFILIAGGMFWLNYTSDGGYVWQHLTHAKTLPFTASQSLSGLIEVLELPTMMIFIGFLAVFAYLNRQFFNWKDRENWLDIGQSPKLLIFFYFLISFAWGTISIGREGANVNYYLECSFLAAIICGLIYESFRRMNFPRLASAFIILLILGGTYQLIRISRGEYFRWQALEYYREISETAAGLISPGSSSTCVSIYDELVVRHGCAFNFDDIGEYTSNWASPELSRIFETEVKNGRYTVIIWSTDDFQVKFPNYRLVPMSEKPPEKFHKVYLYMRETKQP